VVSLKNHGAHGDSLETGGVAVTDLNIGSALMAPVAVLRLAQIISRVRPEIIQGWMYHGNLVAALAHKLRSGGSRLFWNIRASNMDVERYGRIISWNAHLSAWPDVIINNSQASVNIHSDYGFKPRHMEVIPNGVDTVRYRPDPGLRSVVRKELGIAENATVAILVARVDPMKDHKNFLTAVAGLPNVEGLLVGADTEKLALPDNVKALGFRRDIDRLHQASDIIISSFAFGEGFSNALAEGMSTALIPVSTDVGDARLIVGDAGHIVLPRDPEALHAAIAAVARLSAAELRKRGLQARQRILDRFTLSHVVAAYSHLYGVDA
jgi:glycosyltransferase involved in cell wall biosynthesis